jgi:predicted ATPase/DNA-binding CsgD family transcriptional regulator
VPAGRGRAPVVYDAAETINARGGRRGGPQDPGDIVTALTWGQRRDNLPAEVNRFVGRRRELPAIGEALERHRLVTLRGPGGVGKTRLALRAAAGLREAFADGCWLVQLSPLRAPELLPRAVSEALGLPDDATGNPARALAESLTERELLLILDTCDHLTGGCAELAALLLAAAPRLRILATSRAPLDAPGEHSLLIGPLELPADDASAARADAVSLFVERAQAAVPDFALTPGNTPAVAELCRRLDGMPLALELAAVRLRGMSVEEILGRLSDRFRALGTARTATTRHRTLRDTVSWSYELCTLAEQRLWADLSVFPGSFSRTAAERVCGTGAGETLRRLAAKSVVQLSSGGTTPRTPRGAPGRDASVPDAQLSSGGTTPRTDSSLPEDRYWMLDTVREFGGELLGEEAARRVRARHRDYFLELAERAAAGSMTAEQAGWLRRLGAETASLRAALGFSFTEPGEAAAGLRMTRLLLPYWQMTGQFTEGRRWHELALAVNPESGDHAWAVFGAGVLAVHQGDLARGGPLLAEAAALAVAARDENLAAHVTDARGVLALRAGKSATARACHEAALASYERIGFADPTALASYGRLAAVYLQSNEPDRAHRLAAECLRRSAELGEQWARGTALIARGGARWRDGDYPAAIEDALACLRIKEELGDLHTIAMCFDLLTTCLVSTGDVERAAVLRGAADALWKLLNAPVLVGPAYAQIRESHDATARSALGEERFAALRRHGAALPLPAALAAARGEAPAVPADSPLAVPAAGAGDARGSEVRPLTRRELEIAGLVAAGLGNREIAGRLFLSKRTVDSHIEHIFTKLSFSSRAQLAGWFREQAQAG